MGTSWPSSTPSSRGHGACGRRVPCSPRVGGSGTCILRRRGFQWRARMLKSACEGEGVAFGDSNLFPNEVNVGNAFGYRMFDL